MMSCTDKPITMNLYYTGENGNARKFVEEMESSGTADAHHATPMMKTISSLREKYDLTMRAERYYRAEEDLTENDSKFIRE